METINKNKGPILVDFNNMEFDHSVRLNLVGTEESLKRLGISLSEGQKIWISDGEIEQIGIVTMRDGVWVSVPEPGSTKKIDQNSNFHIKNN